jgi:hypothetical protein
MCCAGRLSRARVTRTSRGGLPAEGAVAAVVIVEAAEPVISLASLLL